ncbi:fasciclin-like arabinogalactan protein 15 [Vigna unguiculata]|uniref:fasciclin-like arabinogalactan protein 15 n=1 Tax=Vigna unguiculata TaxID=3917 RepID=UPI0010171CE3|nr:fasciclin-like arabinogalactan protein 15 [Vigna unguiculata]XP_027929138.1 fasciclin-like arabinogalactan protein 15 [Vigna unguiculata]
MGRRINGASDLRIFCTVVFILCVFPQALTLRESSPSSPTAQINSNSILVALLDSHYTELAELVEKAMLLQKLEETVAAHNITIFAPTNEALDRNLDSDFKRFLLEPANLHSLQTLLLSHIIPTRIGFQTLFRRVTTLSNHQIRLSENLTTVDQARVTHPDVLARPDGVIHAIDRLLLPRSVEDDFNRRRTLRSISAVKPEGAPEVDPRTHRLKKPPPPTNPGSPPALPIYDAMSPGPSLAPAPAPGPGGPHHHFNGEKQVKDFIHTLLHYGGYNEMADILVNLTSLAVEMGRLVSEGYILTVLAPNDEAMAKLTTEQLSEPGAPERIMYYHIIPEYQTEESMYNAVRRFGKVRYDTLRLPHKVVAQEADGSVKFGHGDGSAYLFDPDIYTDGRISVQGIDGVLFPMEEEEEAERVKTATQSGQPAAKVVVKHRRGKLLEAACWMLGTFGQHSRFTSCQ